MRKTVLLQNIKKTHLEIPINVNSIKNKNMPRPLSQQMLTKPKKKKRKKNHMMESHKIPLKHTMSKTKINT